MRRTDKALSKEDALALLKRGREGVLGTVSDNHYPYTVVLHYVYYKEKIYFHCAKKGHKLDNINRNNKVSFTIYDRVEVVGEALNTKYESVTLFGKAKIMDGDHDILTALINKYADIKPHQADKMIAKEKDITTVVEIDIEHMTGKAGK